MPVSSAISTAAGLEIATLRRAFVEGSVTAGRLLGQVRDRIARWDDPALWIARVDESAVRERAEALDADAKSDGISRG